MNRLDGLRVKETEPAFADAFDDSPEANQKHVLALKAESTRYNIGDIIRDINVPTGALKVLHESEASRFSFEHAGASRIEGVQTWVVRFREQASPTLVIGAKGEFLYSYGTLWINPKRGEFCEQSSMLKTRMHHPGLKHGFS